MVNTLPFVPCCQVFMCVVSVCLFLLMFCFCFVSVLLWLFFHLSLHFASLNFKSLQVHEREDIYSLFQIYI